VVCEIVLDRLSSGHLGHLCGLLNVNFMLAGHTKLALETVQLWNFWVFSRVPEAQRSALISAGPRA
jgi:hypothetical protein